MGLLRAGVGYSSKQLQQEGCDEGVQSGWVGLKWVLSGLQWVESMARRGNWGLKGS